MTITLNYVFDNEPGLAREQRDGGFVYFYPDGRPVRRGAVIKRIHSLAIPPAYTDVWICRDPNGHIQATGHDARGRKQYRYHPQWNTIRDTTKYERMLAFGKTLPEIRRQVAACLKQDGIARERVLGAVVKLLELTLIRVGNDEYARRNNSYGLTTLLTRHVQVSGSTITFEFRGKSGIEQKVTVAHRGLARIVRLCRGLPGRRLFQYLDDDGRRRAVSSADVNEFLQEISGAEFSAKDYRTWAGSVLAMSTLKKLAFSTETQAKKNIVATVKVVAARLGNTAAVCRKAYIHPALLDAYLSGALRTSAARTRRPGSRADETEFLRFLERLSRTAAALRKKTVDVRPREPVIRAA